MSGLLTVRYKVLGTAPGVKSLYVANTVGKTPNPLSYYATTYGLDNDGVFLNERHEEVVSLEDSMQVQGRIPYAFWTDGRIGFQVLPLRYTWKQVDVDDGAKGDKRMVVLTKDACRHIDLHFIRKAAPRQLRAGEGFELALSFMPFRKYEPQYGVMHYGLERNFVFDEYSVDAELYLRERAADGVTDIIGGMNTLEDQFCQIQFAQSKGWIKDRYRKIIDAAHKFGISVGTTGLAYVAFSEQRAQAYRNEGVIPDEDMRKILAEPWRDKCASFETPEVRDYYLDYYTSCYDEYGVDGMYIDLNCVFIGDQDYTSQIEGNVKYIEDVWLLNNSYDPPKKIISHAGFQFTLLEAMSDAMFPGEGLWGLHVPKVPDALLETAYNPFLLGSEVIPLSYRNYDFRKVEIYNQFLRNHLTMLLPWEGKLNGFNSFTLLPEEKAMYDKYYHPLMSYDTRSAKLYSWRDPETGKIIRFSDSHVVANVFSRPGDVLVVATEHGKPGRKATADINLRSLGFKTDEAFVFDVLGNRLSIAHLDKHNVRFGIDGVDSEPKIYRIKQKNGDGPQVVWQDYNLELTKFEDNTASAKSGQRKMLNIGCKFRTDPREGQDQMFRLYVGDLGAPSVSFAGINNMLVENYNPEEKSIDFMLRMPPLTEKPMLYFNRPLDGPRSTTIEGFIGWEKTFQLSFPKIDAKD
ncbi:MAG: hypothetical protein M1133_14815 [Armatimonadetes bacterium]|nr:hypothetical protein [Armatimonadota bacterium]